MSPQITCSYSLAVAAEAARPQMPPWAAAPAAPGSSTLAAGLAVIQVAVESRA